MPDGTSTEPQDRAISIGDRAVQRVKALWQSGEFAGMMLRVAVSGGGCSGFQYGFSFDDTRNADDRAIEKDGVTVLIDETSWDFLAGGEIDYVEELVGAYFTVRNPNAKATCGCGTSFAVG